MLILPSTMRTTESAFRRFARRANLRNALKPNWRYLAQCSEKHPAAKPLKGFKGAGVLEVVENFDGDTYRAVYTVKLAGVVYVFHAFQKKSKQEIATPKQDIQLIEARLKRAKEHYAEHYDT